MVTHPLVDQLRFTRGEWQRALEGVSPEEGERRFPPINCISWMVGHLAWHEQLYWLFLAQGKMEVKELDEIVATGRPASIPPFLEMWSAWERITAASENYLDILAGDDMLTRYPRRDREGRVFENIGTMLRRLTYHYWYHIGESQAVRQLLGHTELPQFVGKIGSQAPYHPED